MGLLYFVPAGRFPGGAVPDGVKPRRLAGEGAVCLEDLGLAHLDGGITASRVVRTAGPDGGAGLVLGFRVPANETGYFKGAQEWRPVEGGKLYIGWAQGKKPGPDDLIRAGALPSVMEVRMADGNTWGFVPTDALPSTLCYGADGEVNMRPRPCDLEHYAASEWLMGFLQSGESRPYVDTLARVAVCMGARYHVSLLEVLGLELFSTELLQPVVFACLGIDEKKTTGDA